MSLINDAILLGAGSGLTLLAQHFWPKSGVSPSIPNTLDGFGQILSHEGQALVARFDAFEASLPANLERYSKMATDEFKQALAELVAAAKASVVAPDPAPAIAEAVTASQADDLAEVEAAKAALVGG